MFLFLGKKENLHVSNLFLLHLNLDLLHAICLFRTILDFLPFYTRHERIIALLPEFFDLLSPKTCFYLYFTSIVLVRSKRELFSNNKKNNHCTVGFSRRKSFGENCWAPPIEFKWHRLAEQLWFFIRKLNEKFSLWKWLQNELFYFWKLKIIAWAENKDKIASH